MLLYPSSKTNRQNEVHRRYIKREKPAHQHFSVIITKSVFQKDAISGLHFYGNILRSSRSRQNWPFLSLVEGIFGEFGDFSDYGITIKKRTTEASLGFAEESEPNSCNRNLVHLPPDT